MAQQTQPPHLLLHNLIISLSYWGTAVRVMLIGFVLLLANLLTALDAESTVTLQAQSAQFIYLLGSILLLDAGYVTIARVLPIATETIDRVLFLLFIAALGLVVVLPYFAAVPSTVLVSVKWVFLVTLFVLALRLVLGLIFGHRADRRGSWHLSLRV